MAGGDFNMGFLGRFADDERYRSVITRMEALGMKYLGPKTDDNERVPTFHTQSEGPANAVTQFDHVFASRWMQDSIAVQALNDPDEWGHSDHCRILATLS